MQLRFEHEFEYRIRKSSALTNSSFDSKHVGERGWHDETEPIVCLQLFVRGCLVRKSILENLIRRPQ